MTQPAPESPPQALLTLSMKGGVGKTTTAIGLAKALHRRGHNMVSCLAEAILNMQSWPTG